jgi:4,5-dihydroxyphthalate decarboxylase
MTAELTLAINRYDRHYPFFDGTVRFPDGIPIRPLEVGESTILRDGTDRHARMLKHRAFDIAEMSMSSFIMAIAKDPDLSLIGVPIFPRRFFSMGQVYVSAKSDIKVPKDLIGRRVGLHSFQTTLSLLAKGDLKFGYDVPWEEMRWICMRSEIVSIDMPANVRIDALPEGRDIGSMLCDGEIDALISPHPRKSMLARPGDYRRLFPDVHAEEVRYFKKHGFFPIMHVIVLKRELVDEFPELPRELLRMFDEAKELAYAYYNDPNYLLMADVRLLYEQQRSDFGADPWRNGFRANYKNVEQLIAYSQDQKLIHEPFPPERLFHPSTYAS